MESRDTASSERDALAAIFFSTGVQLKEENTAEGNKIKPALKGQPKGILGNIG